MKRTLLLVACLCGLVATMHAAQTPDFSGEWVRDWQASGLSNADVTPARLVIKQDARELSLEIFRGAKPFRQPDELQPRRVQVD